MNSYLQRLQDAIASATRDMSSSDMTRRPAENKWSPAEVLEHLALTYSGTVKNLGRSLAAGKPLGGVPTIRQRLIHFGVLDMGYLPSGRESPDAAKPKGAMRGEFASALQSGIAEMDEVINQCEIKFGKNASVGDHPVLGPFTPQQWRKFHWVHGKHHVKQLLRTRAKKS